MVGASQSGKLHLKPARFAMSSFVGSLNSIRPGIDGRLTPRIIGAAQPRALHALVRAVAHRETGVRLNTRACRDAA
jgi:hypothetical protein